MADTIYLNDGTTETLIGEDKRAVFGRLIYEKLGKEAADYYENICEELIWENNLECEDCKELDGIYNVIRDWKLTLEEILLHVNSLTKMNMVIKMKSILVDMNNMF